MFGFSLFSLFGGYFGFQKAYNFRAKVSIATTGFTIPALSPNVGKFFLYRIPGWKKHCKNITKLACRSVC
jgi:hypothetical protein